LFHGSSFVLRSLDIYSFPTLLNVFPNNTNIRKDKTGTDIVDKMAKVARFAKFAMFTKCKATSNDFMNLGGKKCPEGFFYIRWYSPGFNFASV
jgi:hypothetical protein